MKKSSRSAVSRVMALGATLGGPVLASVLASLFTLALAEGEARAQAAELPVGHAPPAEAAAAAPPAEATSGVRAAPTGLPGTNPWNAAWGAPDGRRTAADGSEAGAAASDARRDASDAELRASDAAAASDARRAASDAELRASDAPVAPPDVPPGRVSLGVGLRSTRVSSAAYAPFSDNKAFAETDFSGYWRVLRQERQALYVGTALGWGFTDAAARSADAHLETFRAELGLQGLHAFRPFLFGVARFGVGALSRSARLTGEAPGTFSQKVWSPTGSAAVGLALRLSARSVDFWFALEGGYRYVPSRRLVLEHPAADKSQTVDAIDLGSLSLGGPTVCGRLGIFF